MTKTTTLKKADAKELQFLIDCELAAYAIRLTGHDVDYTASPDARGNFPRKLFLGAIEQIVERSLIGAVGVLQQRLDQGYKLFLSNICSPEVTAVGAGILYVEKPDAVKAEDIQNITNQITTKYHADIDAHNEKVLAEQAAAEKLALEKEVNCRLAIKQEEERQAMLAIVMAELSAESTTKPAKKAR
ncbi:hypothetical protein [Pseudomonas tussilaginis]|uniref:hypothetical protein n=1 Tax=Pseudomonas putida TaxID=303 RepID=UPI002363B450|nr:hypothetical protein [Pseudomonas putida]MDD1975218.1 hypothetical protein [Pseudomonas putida]